MKKAIAQQLLFDILPRVLVEICLSYCAEIEVCVRTWEAPVTHGSSITVYDQEVCIASAHNSYIDIFTKDGGVVILGLYAGAKSFPAMLSISPRGYMYLCQYDHIDVYEQGEWIRSFGIGELRSPCCVATSAEGEIYVPDAEKRCVCVYGMDID